MSTYSSFPAGYRSAEVQQLQAAVWRGECAAVLGLSGAGKSNLLGFVAQRAALPERILIDCNRMAEASTAGFWNLVRRGLAGNAAQTVDGWTALESSLAARLAAPGSRLCLILDRFDALPAVAEAPVLGGLRALRDDHKYALTYIIAARRPVDPHSELAELFFANTLWLGPLTQADALWSAAGYATRAGLAWDEPVLARLVGLSGGYPALLRAACEAYAANCPLELDDLRRHPAVQQRLAEFWAAGPTPEELQQSRLTGIALLASPTPPTSTEVDTGGLTAKELRLWEYLCAHPGMVCEKDDLIRAVWPEDRVFGQGIRDDSLAQLIRRLRQKIENSPLELHRIQTVPGRGYRYEPPQK